jgi:hypothetical protein
MVVVSIRQSHAMINDSAPPEVPYSQPLAVICSAEVIRDGDTTGGLLFKAWDSGDLAAQLERLLLDRPLHRRLASNASIIAKRFTVEKMADNVLTLLETRHKGASVPEAELESLIES